MDDEKPHTPSVDGRPTTSDLELVWRCLQCGDLWPDRGEPLPDTCRNCAAPKTEFELIQED